MSIEDLNKTLLYFYANREDYKYFKDLSVIDFGKSITKIELQLILQKLIKDGYIIEETQEAKTHNYKKELINEFTKWGLYISYDGIMLIETLPYNYNNQPYDYLKDAERKKKAQERSENWPKRNWILYDSFKIIGAAIIGALIAGGLATQCNRPQQTKPATNTNTQKSKDVSYKKYDSSLKFQAVTK